MGGKLVVKHRVCLGLIKFALKPNIFLCEINYKQCKGSEYRICPKITHRCKWEKEVQICDNFSLSVNAFASWKDRLGKIGITNITFT